MAIKPYTLEEKQSALRDSFRRMEPVHIHWRMLEALYRTGAQRELTMLDLNRILPFPIPGSFLRTVNMVLPHISMIINTVVSRDPKFIVVPTGGDEEVVETNARIAKNVLEYFWKRTDATSTLRDMTQDMVILGNQLPRYTYGFNANATWKGFDFSILFQGVAKQDLYITEIFNGNVFRGPANGPLHMMVYEQHMDYWRDASSSLGANPNAYFAKPYSVFDGDNSKNYGRPVSRYLPSGAYLRMKNIRAGYTIPAKLTKKVLIKSAKLPNLNKSGIPCNFDLAIWCS